MKEADDKYHDLARSALFNGLHDCKYQEDISLHIEKTEILKAFNYSGNILRANEGEEHYRLIAETVFETCIRLTRCLFFPAEARILVLRGKEYSISAEQQLDVLKKNLKEPQEYKS